MNMLSDYRRQRGALMIEVLVTVAIVVIGLLALFQMQSRLETSEVESYQRTQAVMLVNDMANRIASNRLNALDYTTPSVVGADMDCGDIGDDDLRQEDLTEWCLAIQGASETVGTSSVGGMIAGRGCVSATDVTNTAFMISVVWQGLVPIAAPPATVTCGLNEYNVTDTDCESELCRRYVTTIVRVADLGG